MALVVKDRVKESTATTGTGTVTLGGASAGFQAFSAIGDGNTTFYTLVSGDEWEVGVGTYTLSGTTLSRDTVLESSNAGSAITLAGVSDVFCTYPAERAAYIDSGFNGVLLKGNNLSDVLSAATSRVNLGVETGTTGSSILPSGTTAERDGSPSAGFIRWNSTNTTTEVYDGSGWVAVGGPSLGTGAIIRTNGQTISENITIPLGTNGMSIGDITIADTYTVTVNGRWIVI